MTGTSDIWAVTTYFNPAGYKSRYSNYRIFRQHLPLSLLTVELGHDQKFELGESDAEILLKITEGDVMWQKERLFNLAMEHLPPNVTKIVWLDADILFPDPNWADKVSHALDTNRVVQPFSWVKHVNPQGADKNIISRGTYAIDGADEVSVARLWKQGKSTRLGRQKYDSNTDYRYSAAGIAWATTRDYITSLGFFDQCIVGSGDSAFWAGISGDVKYFMPSDRDPNVIKSWEKWRTSALALTDVDIGYIENWVVNLWHGHYRNRGYDSRWGILRTHQFDPISDIRKSPQGAWEWSSQKPGLHAEIRNYFKQRQEDEFYPD